MDIPEEEIAELCAIWQRELGYQLRRDEARSKASLLLDLYMRLCRRLPREDIPDERSANDS